MTHEKLRRVIQGTSNILQDEGVEMSSFDRCQLTEVLSSYLDDRGIEVKEDSNEN